METESMLGILGLAFSLGLIHALDADHIMALCGLTSMRPDFRESLTFCARWAAGHGFTILLLGTLAILLGQAIPKALSKTAENLVGLVLISIGFWVLKESWKNHTHPNFKKYNKPLPDAQLHAHNNKKAKSKY